MLSARTLRLAAAIVLPLTAIGIWTASAQPESKPATAPTVEKGEKGDRGNRGERGDKGAKGDKGDKADKGDKGKKNIREEMKKELKEHPRLARAIVELHDVKEHLQNAPHDFGGHKVAAMKACTEAIQELKEAIRFDAVHDDKRDDKHDEKHDDKHDGKHEKK
jgi:hypothetical protein